MDVEGLERDPFYLFFLESASMSVLISGLLLSDVYIASL